MDKVLLVLSLSRFWGNLILTLNSHYNTYITKIFLLVTFISIILPKTVQAQPTLPPTPRGELATGITAESFTARWSVSDGKNLFYLLSVATDQSFKNLLPRYESLTVQGLAYNVIGLESNTPYFYRVRAFRVYEQEGSAYSGVISVLTNSSTVPVAITILPKTEITHNSLRIYWNKVAKATQYQVEVSTSSTFATGSVISLQADSSAITVQRLSPQTNYFYRVRGINSVGVGNYSVIEFARTLGTNGYTARQVPKSFVQETYTVKADITYQLLCDDYSSTTEEARGWLDTLTNNGICISKAWIRASRGDCTQQLPNGLVLSTQSASAAAMAVELCTKDERITKFPCFRQGGAWRLLDAFSSCANDEFYYYAPNTPVSVRETETNASSLPQFACLYGSVSSEIQIQCRLGQRTGILGIELFDVLGRKVYTSEQNVVNGESNISIPTSQIAQGMYFARCVFQSGVERYIQTLPLVVQH
jgi:hypothetical protein